MSDRPANRLADQTSPYLLQHAHNPVDWYPWGPEALNAARERDVPIFLSIGYAACHWCHVMERESFEDEATAALMNTSFVSIKVDREERPDLDGIYMDAVQAMTGHGGWPMSAFLTPDGRPFYAGTYYPPEPRHGMPSFRQVLTGIAEAWDERRDEIVAQAGKVTESIASVGALEGSNDPLTGEVAREAMQALRPSFDGRWGGFGGAPKFPQPMTLEFCLRQSLRGVPDALEMVVISLDRMAEGGIYDHVGGGFARYSTDGAWHVPHFEKMLYDNAQLVQLYTRAWQVTGEDRYRRVATETVEYLLREMQHPEGGFFSSQDADSEGVEGRFFTWSWEELVDLVGEPVAACFGATVEGNWAGEDGRTNVLWRPIAISAVAREHGLDPTARGDGRGRANGPVRGPGVASAPAPTTRCSRRGTGWRSSARRSRPRVRRAALHRGGEALRAFVLTRLRDADGRLLRSWRTAWPEVPPSATTMRRWRRRASPSTRPRTTSRGSPPRASGRACAAVRRQGARRLLPDRADAEAWSCGRRTCRTTRCPAATRSRPTCCCACRTSPASPSRGGRSALRLVRDVMGGSPPGSATRCARWTVLGPVREVAIVGGDPATRAWPRGHAAVRPNAVIAAPGRRTTARGGRRPAPRPQARDGRPTAYVCERFTCRLPVTHPRRQLDEVATE